MDNYLLFCVCLDLIGELLKILSDYKGLIFFIKWNKKGNYLFSVGVDKVFYLFISMCVVIVIKVMKIVIY